MLASRVFRRRRVDFAFEIVENKYRKDELDPEVDKLLNEVLYKAVVRSLKEDLNV